MDNIQGRNHARQYFGAMPALQFGNTYKIPRLRWNGSVISVPSKRLSKLSRRKKINPPSRTLATKLVSRLELLLATSSGHNHFAGRSDARFEQVGQVEPDGVPRQQGAEIVCDDGFALRSQFPPVLRASLIGQIMLPVRRNQFPVR